MKLRVFENKQVAISHNCLDEESQLLCLQHEKEIIGTDLGRTSNEG